MILKFAGLTHDERNLDAGPLGDGGIVGEVAVGRCCGLAMGVEYGREMKTLRGLGLPETPAIDGLGNGSGG